MTLIPDDLHELCLATETPARFAQHVTRDLRQPWLIAPHLKLMDDMIVQAILDAETATTPPILLIELPPRHGKSELISRYLPPWFIGTYPDKRVLFATNTDKLAKRYGRLSRNIMDEWGAKCFGIQLAPDSQAQNEWNIDGREGGFFGTSIGGRISGRGCQLLVIDDLVGKAEDALSEAMRNKVWDSWEADWFRRLEPRGVVVIVSTRWHMDDLIGRLKTQSADDDGLPIRCVHLPALAESDDSLGRAPGEALWPERFNRDWLERIRANTSPAFWLSLYQQNPCQHEGTEWPGEYFDDQVIWSGGENSSGEWPSASEFIMTAMAIDPAKGKARGDYSAIVFGGVARGLLWVEAIVEPHAGGRNRQKLRRSRWPLPRRPLVVTVEGNGFQDLGAWGWNSTASTKRRNIAPLPIRFVDSTTNKQDRIRRLGTYFQQHRLRFRSTAGCKRLVQQLREFPLGEFRRWTGRIWKCGSSPHFSG